MNNPSIRYGQCDDTCTVDCGHCKGEGPPAVPSARVDLDLDEIEARANAATPGPWDVGPYGTSFTSRHVGRIVLAPMIAPASFDAEFIAHAREDVPRLVAEVRRLREIVGSDGHLEAMLGVTLPGLTDALKEVRDLHERTELNRSTAYCAHCAPPFGWPCPTVRALDAALGSHPDESENPTKEMDHA